MDDTTFFNPNTIWPDKPEVIWVQDALNSDMTWVIWIHDNSWGADTFDDKVKDIQMFCHKQSVAIDLNEDEDDDKVYYSSKGSKQQK